MSPSRRTHSLCLLLALAAPSLALASPPSAANSTAPACISLVGSSGGVPAAGAGAFTCIIRDLANNPLAGAVVVIDLSSVPEMFLCADQMDPAAIVNCANKTVSKLTAADGSVHFTVLGGSRGNAVTLLGGGRIFENGTLIQSPTVSAFDLDGSSGLGANDLSIWFGDFGSGNPYGRSDFDCSGSVGANDLSIWLNAYGSGAMAQSCASQCP